MDHLWAKPIPCDGPATIADDASAVFYVGTNDLLVAYDSTNATELVGATVSNGWNKIALSCDYVSKVWNLELNDALVVSNFAFHSSPTSFQALEITEGSSNTLFVDSIEITDSLDDSDNDGLPDDWETEHFGDLNANPGDIASNGVDTVYSAYIAGLDPTSLTNRFLISNVRNILQWSASSGRVYSVWWSSNLLSGFQPLESNIPWQAMPFTDTNHPADGQGFYKIDVELE